jgi:hypothetical protein
MEYIYKYNVTHNNAVFWNVPCVVLVRTEISEECIASIIRAERIRELGTTLSVLVTANAFHC